MLQRMAKYGMAHALAAFCFCDDSVARCLVAHAGGDINGHRLSNSVEAFDASAKAGFDFFEVDLRWTSDEQLVAIHDWGKTFKYYYLQYDSFWRWVNNWIIRHEFLIFADQRRPDFKQYRKLQMNYELNSMAFSDVLGWLERHPNTWLTLDIKAKHEQALQFINRRITPELRQRLLPEARNPLDLRTTYEAGFNKVVAALHDSDISVEDVVANAGRGVLIAALPDRAKPGVIARLRAHDIPVLVYTINSEERWRELRLLGASGIYTDSINPDGISLCRPLIVPRVDGRF